jgi:hypothetical protein
MSWRHPALSVVRNAGGLGVPFDVSVGGRFRNESAPAELHHIELMQPLVKH